MIRWTERKFYFGYTPDYLPLFIERLKTTVPRIEEMVKDVTDEMLRIQPEGKWSAKEHIGHLSDLEELHEGRIDDFKESNPSLRPADMSNKKTESAHYNSMDVTELISNLKNVRTKFIDRVLATDKNILIRKSFHPRLNEMISLTDMLYFINEHDNQHLALMSRILKK